MIFLDTIYQDWLTPFEDDKSCLEPAPRQLIQEMNLALDVEEFCKVWKLLDRLLAVSYSSKGINECAEIHLWCARVQYLMCNLKEAARLYREVISRCPPKDHMLAVAQWLLGYVLWQMPGEKEDAITSWERSKATFEAILRDHRFLPTAKRNWYTARKDEVKAHLAEAIENKAIFMNRRTLELTNGCMTQLVIVGNLKEIKFKKPKLDNPEVLLRITRQLDVLKIPHHIYNIYDDRGRIRISNDTCYKLYHVIENKFKFEGNEYNLGDYGIEKGDYLVFEVDNHAREDELVIVSILDKDGFLFPIWNEFRERLKSNDHFIIEGKAVALLKPDVQPMPKDVKDRKKP